LGFWGFGILGFWNFWIGTKGQSILKANCQAVNSSKKRTNGLVFSTMQRFFVRFLEEIEDSKKAFRNHLTFSTNTKNWARNWQRKLGLFMVCLPKFSSDEYSVLVLAAPCRLSFFKIWPFSAEFHITHTFYLELSCHNDVAKR
jgi:hypothetical protein